MEKILLARSAMKGLGEGMEGNEEGSDERKGVM